MIVNRDYYSWSQHYLFNTSKRAFWKRYGLNEFSKSNARFDKGKELGTYLEKGEVIGANPDSMIEIIGDKVPKLDIMEDRLSFEVGGKEILGFTDSANIEHTLFYEYKTGKIPWTQMLVDNHQQLDFYALGYYINSGRKIIPECKLIWIETEDVEQEDGSIVIKYTGIIEEFERKFLLSDLVIMEESIIKSLKDIEEFEYLELPIENDLVDDYLQKKKQIETLTIEMNEIKTKVAIQMEADEVLNASADNGRFSFVKRKTWSYSKSLTDLTNDYKSAVKALEAWEKKNNIAEYTEKQSILFKEIK